MKRFIAEYKVELLAFVAGLLGVFLIVEKFSLRKTLAGISQIVASATSVALDRLFNYFVSFSLSDLLGWVIILLVIAFIVWRIRYRFSHSARFYAGECPQCGGELHRVHRTGLDHFLERIFFPNARRYRCANNECAWSGLRRRRASDHRQHRTAVEVE